MEIILKTRQILIFIAMKKRYIFEICCTAFIFSLFFLYFSCDNDDEVNPQLIQLLQNSDMESGINNNTWPQSWGINIFPEGGQYDFVWTDQVYYSPTRSVMIFPPISYDSIGAGWMQSLNHSIPHNRDIKFTVQIKAENLVGEGAAILIRADNSIQQEMLKFASTEGDIDINGTFDWKEYSIEMDSVPDYTNIIVVGLAFLPKTTGTVYFDNAELTYEMQ